MMRPTSSAFNALFSQQHCEQYQRSHCNRGTQCFAQYEIVVLPFFDLCVQEKHEMQFIESDRGSGEQQARQEMILPPPYDVSGLVWDDNEDTEPGTVFERGYGVTVGQ